VAEGFARECVAWLDSSDDLAAVDEVRLRLEALDKYLSRRSTPSPEVATAARIGEVRVGELLGPGVEGRPAEETAMFIAVSDRNDRAQFRLMAAWRAVVEKVLAGETDDGKPKYSRNQILKAIHREQLKQRGREADTDKVRLIVGDVLDVAEQLGPESVDVIVTDPPYKKEFLPAYSSLSEAARIVLKPDGLCVVMCGQSWLPEVYRRLGERLDYFWTFAYRTPGQAPAQLRGGINSQWKPLLVYAKGVPGPNDWPVSDVVTSSGNEKDEHDWQQSAGGMRDILRRLTFEGQLVWDPFCGGGSTPLAALQTSRPCVASDIDPEQVDITRGRILAYVDSANR